MATVCQLCGLGHPAPGNLKFCENSLAVRREQCEDGLMENRNRAARAMTQPLQLRKPRETSDFATEATTEPGFHRPEPDRYNVEGPSTTRATQRIERDFTLRDDIGVDAAYEYIIYEYGG